MTAVEITSFGYLHGEPPTAHLTVDLRHHFRDPHVSPELRYMTADDEPVRLAVLGTPGIVELIDAAATAVRAFLSGPSAGPVSVAVGCAGGRHRAATVARTLALVLRDEGLDDVTVTDRDLMMPVVQRDDPQHTGGDMPNRQEAVTEAARAVIDHGGPECRTDPHATLAAMGRAYDLGATSDDIRAEMARQRTA